MFTKRSRNLNKIEYRGGEIVYWMSRDQRVNDNWALLLTQKLAKKHKVRFSVLFNLVPKFLGATDRQYDFMFSGLEKVEKELRSNNIEFKIVFGDPEIEIPKHIEVSNIGALICDFSPLRIGRKWRELVAKKINIPFIEVDAHNIIPCWELSEKEEFAAYTIRPKIKKKLEEFLTEFPKIENQKIGQLSTPIDWQEIRSKISFDSNVRSVDWILSGEDQAKLILDKFLKFKISQYSELKNDPNLDFVSNLSPYLHFGQLSAQRVVHDVLKTTKVELPKNTTGVRMWSNYEGISNIELNTYTFLEEIIVRRELADNFCFYNKNYDNTEGFAGWSKESFKVHSSDPREFIYSIDEFENATTHDDLWNTAQKQMVVEGKMHGYLRMYWAKKILEWSESAKEAMKTAIFLNDKYELDGRDPNGYAGIAWSIGGVHDRAWTERNIFGKVRYMNLNGMKRKFDVDGFIQKYKNLTI